MVEDHASSNDLLATTDCLEAVGVFKRWKDLLFLILVVCLLLMQASFYLVDQGYVKITGHAYGNEPAAAGQPEEANPALQLAKAANVVNAVLILTATLYCLTLLLSLEVFPYSRLGGIQHITRAFYLSLLMLVLLLPWQRVFGNAVIGAVFAPDEMMKSYSSKTEDMLGIVLYYLRFSGYGVSMLLLLILSQLRSLRWAKAILHPLDIAMTTADGNSVYQPASSAALLADAL